MTLCGASVPAIDGVSLSVSEIAGDGWRAAGLHTEFAWAEADRAELRLEVAQVTLDQLQQQFDDVEISCPSGDFTQQKISCPQGRLAYTQAGKRSLDIPLDFIFDQQTRHLEGRLRRMPLAGGLLDLELQWSVAGWRVQAQAKGLNAAALRALLPQERRPLADWTMRGALGFSAKFQGGEGRGVQGEWQAKLADFSFSDATGGYVGEKLTAQFNGKLSHPKDSWIGDLSLRLPKGESLTPYGYLDAAAHPLRLNLDWGADDGFTRMSIDRMQLAVGELLALHGGGSARLEPEVGLEQLRIEIEPLELESVQRELLEPVLLGTPLAVYHASGKLGLEVDLAPDANQVRALLDSVGVAVDASEGGQESLRLDGVSGRVNWDQRQAAALSSLIWSSGLLLEHIGIGPGEMRFAITADEMHLTDPMVLPVMDGELRVERLNLAGLTTGKPRLGFDAILTPVSLGPLTEALGWPRMAGKLSGVIPGLTYDAGLVQVEGALLARILGGDVVVRKLQLRNLLDVYPQLNADIEIHGLDLEQLTETFSFGRITGKLDGYVRELSLENWSPIGFDARFYTPEKDESRHRISQRAVDNIANLGGAGLSGTLARSFLRFFDEFDYRRIGIGCRLEQGSCEMVGAGPAKQGYYLVEGRGIPRIDILGFNHSADWQRLVSQLKQMTQAPAPVIE